MKTITSFFKLIRVQNLLIMAILMYFIRYFILIPVYALDQIELQMDGVSFFLFVIGYLLLAAGGYAINDYYDIGMDEINRPEKTILRKSIPLSRGRHIYYILTGAGVLISLWAILLINAPKLIFVLAIVTLLYWFYTTKYKREFLSGNIAVSFLAALCVGIVWLYEFFAGVYNAVLPINQLRILTYIILAYSGFAFITTFLREIIKDIADIEGDKEFGCKSIPIVLGMKKTHLILVLLQVVLFIGILMSAIYFFRLNYMYMLSFTAVLIILLIVFSFRLMKANDRKDYLFISDFVKIIFLAGIVSIQIFSLELQ